MLNRSASLAMSTSVLNALPGKLDIKRHSPSILYIQFVSLVLQVIDDFVKSVKGTDISIVSQEIFEHDPLTRVENLKVGTNFARVYC